MDKDQPVGSYFQAMKEASERIAYLEAGLQAIHDDEHVNFGMRNYARSLIEGRAAPPRKDIAE